MTGPAAKTLKNKILILMLDASIQGLHDFIFGRYRENNLEEKPLSLILGTSVQNLDYVYGPNGRAV
jgi:hypothetical protein